MLNVQARIELIENLYKSPIEKNLTYAALECRLTIEYLCYERFRLLNPYLGEKDLNNWTPAKVVEQVSKEIDDQFTRELKISISPDVPSSDGKPTVADFEALDFQELGMQSELKFKKLHRLWQGVSNVALHIPVPTIANNELSIYGESKKIRKKIDDCLVYFKTLSGNLLFGGIIGEVFSFNCLICETEIRRPVASVKKPTHVHCINPKCLESYMLTPDEGGFDYKRQTISFKCIECGDDLVVPLTQFYKLTINHTLSIKCTSCSGVTEVIMRPQSKCLSEST